MCAAKPMSEQERVVKKMRPLLFDLERVFFENAGEDKQLDTKELSNIWKAEALKATGKLSEEDIKLIEQHATELMSLIDVDHSGKISYDEFVAHSMGGTEARGALRDMRKQLDAELKTDPKKLQELIRRFKSWDKNQDGFVTEDELGDYISELAADPVAPCCFGCGVGAASPAKGDVKDLAAAKKLKEELLEVADVDRDGKVDLWELIAWALGRRKQPVELLLYDISKGATAWAGPLLLGRFDLEAFHSAVFVYGSEYWYGGKVFRTDPPATKQFGQPIKSSPKLTLEPSAAKPELNVVRMGYTFVTHNEFLQFLQDKVIKRYTGVEGYDLLTHSCNHFSDECMHFLLGRGVPAHVLELQQIAASPSALALRPYLNRYLGGFSQNGGGGDQLLDDSDIHAGSGSLKPEEMLGAGAVVVLDGGAAGIGDEGSCVIATILAEKDGKCDVKYFDEAEHKVATKTGVPLKAVQRRVQK